MLPPSLNPISVSHRKFSLKVRSWRDANRHPSSPPPALCIALSLWSSDSPPNSGPDPTSANTDLICLGRDMASFLFSLCGSVENQRYRSKPTWPLMVQPVRNLLLERGPRPSVTYFKLQPFCVRIQGDALSWCLCSEGKHRGNPTSQEKRACADSPPGPAVVLVEPLTCWHRLLK